MRRIFAIAALLLLFVVDVRGQECRGEQSLPKEECVTNDWVRQEYDFGRYLVGKGLLRDATTLVSGHEGLITTHHYTTPSLDSLHYLKGIVDYHSKRFDQAIRSFDKVTATSPTYAGSSFYGSVCHLLAGDTEGARQRLNIFSQSPSAAHHEQLLALHRGGIALLEGDREEYGRQQSLFDYSHPIVANHQRALDRVAAGPPRQPKAWVAGVASAIVPGLGQIYAGQVSEGVASFMAVGAFAALTATSWAKAESPANPRTIIYGSIASLLYVSNIFGSVASVKVYYQNFEEINREAVMYSIHIPLRELFD